MWRTRQICRSEASTGAKEIGEVRRVAAAPIVYQAPRAGLDAGGEAWMFLVTRDQLTVPVPLGEAPLVVLECEPVRFDTAARSHAGRGVGVSMSLTGPGTSPE